jgi:hypothetical protein
MSSRLEYDDDDGDEEWAIILAMTASAGDLHHRLLSLGILLYTGHATRMDKRRNANRILVGNATSRATTYINTTETIR